MDSSHLNIFRLLAAERRACLNDVAMLGAMGFQYIPPAAG